MNYTFRKVRATDIEQVYNLICELEERKLDRENFYTIYTHNLNDLTTCAWVCCIENEFIAYGSVHIQKLLHHAGKVAEIQELFVKEPYRKVGIGKNLVDYAEAWAKEQGAVAIEVSTNQKRIQAHKFYERENYTKTHFKLTKTF